MDESFDFDLTITGLNREDCVDLLLYIAAKVEGLGGQVAGGFKVASEAEVDDGEES